MSIACIAITGASLTFLTSSKALAQTETVAYTFQGGTPDGANPNAGLISDGLGNLYGTTPGGGTYGTVFKLIPLAGGQWGEQIIHYFTGADGSGPQAGLVMDHHGNLYGTTSGGGNYNQGVAFQLRPVSGGWTFAVLHNFNFDGVNNFDGARPYAKLRLDKKGNLYGTTEFGGTGPCSYFGPASFPKGQIPSGCGTVFKLSPHPDGTWSEKILYNFQGGSDGGLPFAGLVFDPKGNLYGTTSSGGGGSNRSCGNYYDTGCGVVFSLSHSTTGNWVENVLYTFTGLGDGAGPTAGLVFDKVGNLYGTTAGAGPLAANSTVFQLSPSSAGPWTETTLFSFPNDGSNGYSPLGGVIFDAVGSLYGTTYYGSGTASASLRGTAPPPKNLGNGIVFKLTPSTSGPWTETVLHSFAGGTDGIYPGYDNLLYKKGTLYGTTTLGGSTNSGTVFTVVP
jgi:hypothetical protein